jgi:hypothetical protein
MLSKLPNTFVGNLWPPSLDFQFFAERFPLLLPRGKHREQNPQCSLASLSGEAQRIWLHGTCSGGRPLRSAPLFVRFPARPHARLRRVPCQRRKRDLDGLFSRPEIPPEILDLHCRHLFGLFACRPPRPANQHSSGICASWNLDRRGTVLISCCGSPT